MALFVVFKSLWTRSVRPQGLARQQRLRFVEDQTNLPMRIWPKPSRFAVCCLIATSFLLGNKTTAQTTSSGALTGLITDQTNAVVQDAAIEIKNGAKGTTRSTKTDREGLYHFFFLAPGKYIMSVAH